MGIIEFIRQSLNQIQERILGSANGLSRDDFLWRPAPHANCIGDIVWHMVRSEDRLVRVTAGLGPELWVDEQWYSKFGYPKESPPGNDYQALNAFSAPPKIETLLSYMEAVHKDTIAILSRLSPMDLDRVPHSEQTRLDVGAYLRHLITHKNNHHGQIDFIRGMTDPNWDLPRGTGMVQR